MKVLAFAGSNHSASINRMLVGYAAKRLQELAPQTEIELLDLNDFEMPIYSIDREAADGIHPLAHSFYNKIGEADAVIVSFAEYNGMVTSAWKNIFDWMTRIDQKVWHDNPVVILAASPGARAGANVLEKEVSSGPRFGMDLRGSYGVGNWDDAWDGERLTKPDDIEQIDALLHKLTD